MNSRVLALIFLLFFLSTTAALILGSHATATEVLKLVKDVERENLSREAETLVTVTRNDFIEGNTRIALVALEKAINSTGISQIDVKSADGTIDKQIGEISTEQLDYAFTKVIKFSGASEAAEWGTLTFKVSNAMFGPLLNKFLDLQIHSFVPVILIVLLMLVGIFYILGFSSLFLHHYFTENSMVINGLDKSFFQKLLWSKLIINILAERKALIESNEEKAKLKISADFANIARQVAHDVRSPLSALSMVSATFTEVSEDKRILVKNAVNRINDIANDLLKRSNLEGYQSGLIELSPAYESASDIVLLDTLIDQIVSEKRTVLINQPVEILSDISGMGAFSKADAKELSRILSNLLNNSIEAMNNKNGKITLALRNSRNSIQVIIQDNGKGIPPMVLEKLGQPGVSYGKNGTESGNGLGIYHAKKYVDSIGGNFSILSQVGIGTMITIDLPRAEAPRWFLSELKITDNSEIIILDDDESVHNLWQLRFKSNNNFHNNIILRHFKISQDFKSDLQFSCSRHSKLETETLTKWYLIDLELIGEKTNGLEIISELKIRENTILVTSRYDEPDVLKEVENLGIKLLPKSLVGVLPILFIDANADILR